MWLTKNPEDYGVIVSGNMFGDIVSDGFAGLVGGLGFACSANIGRDVRGLRADPRLGPEVREATRSIVNPIAMILSACMMLDHLGEGERAERIRAAMAEVVAEGQVRTYDMLRLKGGAGALEHGAATTSK